MWSLKAGEIAQNWKTCSAGLSHLWQVHHFSRYWHWEGFLLIFYLGVFLVYINPWLFTRCVACVTVPCVPGEICSHWLVGETEICLLVPVNISEASFEMSENAVPSSLTNFISFTLGHLTVSVAQADSSLSVIHKTGAEFALPRWKRYDCVA